LFCVVIGYFAPVPPKSKSESKSEAVAREIV